MKDRPQRSIHQDITNQIIAAIEADPGKPVLPWRMAGGSPMPVNTLSGKQYNGINILSLWVAAHVRHYRLPVWGTYRQWQQKGCQVRKGEKSSLVVFYKEYETEPQDEEVTGTRHVARASYVFNADQVEGFIYPDLPETLGPVERIERAISFVEATCADVRHGGDRAFFHPAGIYIQMPLEGLFTGTDTMSRTEGYYATLLHELVHWSGASRRLGRDMTSRFGTATYAAEELVAEIGAAFLCSELQITQDVRPDHAAYIASWLKLLKSDPKAIFTAAARASEAVRFLGDFNKPAVEAAA